MQALVTAGALVALSDGRVEAAERDELVNFVDQQGFVPTISRQEIAEAFGSRVRQLDRDANRRYPWRANQTLRRLSSPGGRASIFS